MFKLCSKSNNIYVLKITDMKRIAYDFKNVAVILNNIMKNAL